MSDLAATFWDMAPRHIQTLLEWDVTPCYSPDVGTAEIGTDESVHGLVDSRRAAALLGVEVNTFKVWATRSQTARSGIAAAMPKPVATMHGQVYRVADIEEFGRHIALSARASRSKERGLGAYFTPHTAATVMARWAVRSPEGVILEPSLGDGQFALAAQAYAASRGWGRPDLHACELDPDTASRAVAKGAVTADRLHVGDFLAETRLPQVDAVIGNPPYVRVRELSSPLRRSALRAASLAMGSEMDKAGSAWLPFVAKATTHLRDGGRLALVLPLDFTYVRYARPLWEFLGRSYGRLRVLRFRERVFPDILQNVLILLAEGKGQLTDEIELIARGRLADLPEGEIGAGVPIPLEDILDGERAFQFALLPEATRSVLADLAPHTVRSSERMKFNIGYVSGSKAFFHPSAETIKQYRLPARSLTPTVASSRQLSRQDLATSAMTPSAYLWLPGDRLTEGEKEYIAQGEQDGVDMAYKCRIRSPWFKVPGVKIPDMLLTTFSDPPRLHRNDAGWVASNSVLCGFMRPGEDPDIFASSWYTPLTLLSAELMIHSLGGGVMIAVPREADSVQVLSQGSTHPLDPTALSASLQSRDRAAPYAVGTSSIENVIGTSGLDALWTGVETLTAWRRAQS